MEETLHPLVDGLSHKNPKLTSYDLQCCTVTEQFPFKISCIHSILSYIINVLKHMLDNLGPKFKAGSRRLPRLNTALAYIQGHGSQSIQALWGWKQMANNRG